MSSLAYSLGGDAGMASTTRPKSRWSVRSRTSASLQMKKRRLSRGLSGRVCSPREAVDDPAGAFHSRGDGTDIEHGPEFIAE